MWVITYGSETPRLAADTETCAAIIERMLEEEEAPRVPDRHKIADGLEEAKADDSYEVYGVDWDFNLVIRAYWVEVEHGTAL